MKPENSEPLVGQEQLVMPPASAGERVPVLPTPEAGIELGTGRVEQAAEASAAVADAAAASAQMATTPDPTAITTDDNPLVAADEDVIEKEWVDKARKIIDSTKDDPHARSAKVSDLQKDYLQKRYGKTLGTVSE